jgi:homogentisate 1,2-dioxygenase
MLHRHTLGKVPAKPHTAFYDDNDKLLMEVCITREGFSGAYSILYYRRPPTDEASVQPFDVPGFCPFSLAEDGGLRRRHVVSAKMPPGGDFLTGRRTLLVNDDLHAGLCKPVEPPGHFFASGDGDELFFVNQGSGFLESVYGVLPFRQHDYLLIPKSTPYRIHLERNEGTLLVFEGRPRLVIPGEYRNRWGQLTDYAPFSHRDFRLPTELLSFDEQRHGKPPYCIVVKRGDTLSLHEYAYWPHDIVGWDGAVYPIAFNIHDFQPKTGLVHLPPTIHTTFAGDGFVVCSFVPRVVDFHEQAIPCPYGHSSGDMDEILYYVEGNFTSRRGIEAESISLHPAGIPHGPHPGAYEKSIGTQRTSELAVMCDTYRRLHLTSTAADLEDPGYHASWIR